VRKVWKYHAENVHDFAFTADPTYRIGHAEWNGIQCIAMAQEPHASRWQNAAEYAARCIRVHSEQTSACTATPKWWWPTPATAWNTPCSPWTAMRRPGYRSLFMHEIGHNWFFGMVGNNETYRAMLDEGFTQFITAWGLEHADGDTMVRQEPENNYVFSYTEPVLARENQVYGAYIRAAVRDELGPISTHSDEFGHVPSGYRLVYYKTATMLYNLQYVLGDELFINALRHYFAQWKFKHPYVEDFRQSITDFTKADLNWFFDQWIDTGKRIDYAVKGVRHRSADAGQEISFKRVGDLQMPIDFTVTANDGHTFNFHIPNTWFTKQTNATVLPRWSGFGDLDREYIAHVDIPTGIAEVQIDPTHRLADAYQLNNSLAIPVDTRFDSHVRNAPGPHHLRGFRAARPLVQRLRWRQGGRALPRQLPPLQA
jgi:hypothetical protein